MKKTAWLLTAVLLFVSGISYAGEINRAVFTSRVDQREPVGELTQLTNEYAIVYFFTEVKGLEGHKITHRWEYEGQVQAEITFEIGGPRWRVWSSKEMMPEWVGTWTVSVIDDIGIELTRKTLNYVPANNMQFDTKDIEVLPEEELPVISPLGDTYIPFGTETSD